MVELWSGVFKLLGIFWGFITSRFSKPVDPVRRQETSPEKEPPPVVVIAPPPAPVEPEKPKSRFELV